MNVTVSIRKADKAELIRVGKSVGVIHESSNYGLGRFIVYLLRYYKTTNRNFTHESGIELQRLADLYFKSDIEAALYAACKEALKSRENE